MIDLCQWLRDEFALTVSKQTLARELRALGYRKLSARGAIMRKRRAPSRLLKKSPRALGRDRARARCRPRRR